MKQVDVPQMKLNDQQYVMHSWSRQDHAGSPVITKAKGIFFWDDQNHKYYDMCSQLVYLNVGHQHPKLLEEFKQIGEYPLAAPAFASAPKSELARKIIEAAPGNMAKVFFTNGGADSNDHAVKIARMATGRYKIFSRYRSYHGATFGAGNLTGENRRFTVEPGIPGFVKFETPYLYREVLQFESDEAASAFYLDRLHRQIQYEGPDRIAAVFLEPIPGSNGVLIPPKGYLEGVRELCDRYGILMICDEVMTGFGRTGKMFAVSHYDFEPDMITFAKGVTSGYSPLGGVILSRDVAKYFDKNIFMTGLTYSGHTVSTQIGCAAMEIYQEENLIENAHAVGKALAERLEKLRNYDSVGDVRHIGLFAAVELVKDKQTKEPLSAYGMDYGKDKSGLMKKFTGILAEKGFYTYSHESSVIIAPPLIITEQQVNEAMDLFEAALGEFEKNDLFPGKTLIAK
ncbi:aminotransferase class III-fold pyridoxal phosphate-dependent enzyme [Bacillus coagulans]|uniref:aminotransferase class III-fold pyridoxal phosphate-dependent enzyme n=1 Tax=Heyndrickxia TaxID=2837504 RepID=UPI001376F8D6|nr:aminotransferase class III-fold pyridoxal phosphate-dependent enzyme [Heyndrickxia coagulans]MDT9757002.1 aminotransferase class III-fold pyridoxal phosphate-dependent enzyme [Heyndrickxia coagulans]NCG68891.1 aminotransferase class III-fold pyridoxal phosphate-dependent enzyme [Heyndrickxia coagulans]